jgi:hypothetical protein
LPQTHRRAANHYIKEKERGRMPKTPHTPTQKYFQIDLSDLIMIFSNTLLDHIFLIKRLKCKKTNEMTCSSPVRYRFSLKKDSHRIVLMINILI